MTQFLTQYGLWFVAALSALTLGGLSWYLGVPAGERQIPPPVIVSLGLGLVGGVSFATFYNREGDRPMRLALTVTFVSMYLLLFTLMIANPGFRESIERPTFGPGAVGEPTSTPSADSATSAAPAERVEPLGVAAFNGFQVLVTTIVGFYFATQAAESIVDKLKTGTSPGESGSSAPGEGKPPETA